MDIRRFFTWGKKGEEKTKTIVMKRDDPLKKMQVQDLRRQSGNFSNHGNPTSHGLFTEMEQCFFFLHVVCRKKNLSENFLIINTWLVKNIFG